MSTVNILTSPIINGTPTGSGLPTYVLKRGDGSGTYTTAQTTFQDVDVTNLSHSTTVPTGWKLSVQMSGGMYPSTLAVNVYVALYDGDVVKDAATVADTTSTTPFYLQTIITGDNAVHYIRMRFKTSNVGAAANLSNSTVNSVLLVPSILLRLEPAN